ncbi:helix-turn-helix transcriptional regulator [Enterococcus pingfangensis]
MRIERLISMIMILLKKEIVSTQEFAERFGVSKRTILRDVETLSVANIPIYTQRGRNGGIGLLPNYKVDKKLLTAQDIQHLLTALSGVQQLIESPEIQATIAKIQAMQEDQTSPESLSIQHTSWIGSTELKTLAEQLSQAIKKRQLVTFDYFDREGQLSQRTIEPYHLTYKGERWYLQAFSLERQDWRTFRLSRMMHYKISRQTFVPREFQPRSLTLDASIYPVFVLLTLKADQLIRDVLVERFGGGTVTATTQNEFLIEVKLPQNEASFRFLLSLGKHAQIVQSEGTFLAEFKNYLQEVATIYR